MVIMPQIDGVTGKLVDLSLAKESQCYLYGDRAFIFLTFPVFLPSPHCVIISKTAPC